jgi:RNA polymerase sigma-54 factor
MGLGLRPEFRMAQNLFMSQRMQQAIKILQLNHLEMAAHIEEQMLENPTLEASNEGSELVSDLELARLKQADVERKEAAEQANGSTEVDWERFIDHLNDHRGVNGATGGTIHDDLPPIETNLTYGHNLTDHLLWQMQMLVLTDPEREAADYIVRDLDSRGYLVSPIAEIAETVGVPLEEAESALGLIQQLDPLGCGARDLIECLLIQARVFFEEDPNFEIIIKNHLPNLERRNYAAIAKDLGADLEDVIEYHKMIQELEPHPGRGYSSDEPRYITPDVYVEKHGGEWVIAQNEEGIPDLKISSYYQKILRDKGAAKTDKEYLREKLSGAVFLIKSIHKRRRTIRRVVEAMIRYQVDFFERGPANLRPMVLQDIASELGVHMSTVSRVTTNKYMHTPHGIFELKYFFSSAVKQQSGEDMAAEAVKSRIRQLVSGEDGRRPLSDQAIADKLKKEGVNVARRTVAKYREAMGILSSAQRKQFF